MQFDDKAQTGMEDEPPDAAGRQVQLRVEPAWRRDANQKPDDDEGHDDGCRRAEEIERKRQRQIVTLAEAVRGGWDRLERDRRTGEAADGANPARPRWLADIPPHVMAGLDRWAFSPRTRSPGIHGPAGGPRPGPADVRNK